MWHAVPMQASAKKGIRAERVLEEKKQEQAGLQKERLLLDRRNKKRRAELDRKVGLPRCLGSHAAGCRMPVCTERKVRIYQGGCLAKTYIFTLRSSRGRTSNWQQGSVLGAAAPICIGCPRAEGGARQQDGVMVLR